MTQKQKNQLSKIIDKAEIVVFNKEDITKRIRKANELKTKALKMLAESDSLLDKIQKELYGDTN